MENYLPPLGHRGRYVQKEMLTPPRTELIEGIAILMPFLQEHGFQHTATEDRRGSGGMAAMGTIAKQERSIALHHRFGLGIVEYKVKDCTISHEQYLDYLGIDTDSQFLWCRMDLGILRYKALLYDLTQFFDDFLTGDGHVVVVGKSTLVENENEQRTFELNAEALGESKQRQ
jgi:hypothetical protein